MRSARSVSIRDIPVEHLERAAPGSVLHQLAKKRPRGRSRDLEHGEQVKLFTWAAENLQLHPALGWLFAVPNFSGRLGDLTAKHGARLKAEGRKSGVPDVLLPVRRGGYVGLAIEMKAGNNQPRHAQKLWLSHFSHEGWLTHVAYSFEEARDVISKYLDQQYTLIQEQ